MEVLPISLNFIWYIVKTGFQFYGGGGSHMSMQSCHVQYQRPLALQSNSSSPGIISPPRTPVAKYPRMPE